MKRGADQAHHRTVVFVDGAQVGEAVLAGAARVARAPGFVGSLEGNGDFFQGGLDDARVYSLAMTTNTIFGWYAVDSDGDGMYDAWEVNNGLGASGSLGGGFKVPIGKRVAFRLELRGYATISSTAVSVACGEPLSAMRYGITAVPTNVDTGAHT